MLTGLIGDLRFGMRVLLKNRTSSLVMITTLALAVGANTALFSIVYQVLLSPLPFQQEGQLFFLLQGPGRSSVSPRNYQDWKDNSRLFDIAAFDSFSLTLTGESSPRRLEALRTSHDFLAILGVPPTQGRFFTNSEDRPGAQPVAVISDLLWETEMASDPAALGSTIVLDGIATTVIGILPESFEFLGETRHRRFEVIVPLALTEKQLEESQRGAQWIATIGRLAQGQTPSQARQEFTAIVQQLRTLTNRVPDDFEVTIVPVREMMVGRIETVLWALFGGVGLVLLIAVINVAGLMLARATARKGEFAVRSALGAGTARLARQTVIESLLVALLAGALGLMLAVLTRDLLIALAPANAPRLSSVGLNTPVLLFSFLVTAGAGILFGLTPATTAWKVNLLDALTDLQRSTRGSALTRRFGTVLVAAEIALAVIILTSAGLLARSLLKLERVDPGFNIENVLRFRLSLPSANYETVDRVDAFYRDFRERLSQLPGVIETAGTMHLPLGSDGNVFSSFNIEDSATDNDEAFANLRPVTPGYFSTMGIPLLAGREFHNGDDQQAPGVMLVNQTFAAQFFPGQEALGRRVRPHVGLALGGRSATIVGIVGDVHHSGLEQTPDPEMYIPHSQSPVEDMSLIVKSATPAENLIGSIQSVVREFDATLPIFDISTLDEIRSSSLAASRFQTLLFGAFALIALFLAAVGVFGLISYRVSAQTREIGVRRALGAQDLPVLLMVIRQGLYLTLTGLVIGLIGAFWVGELIRNLLYQVEPTDPLTVLSLTAVLLSTVLLAILPPALRAIRIAPLIALRGDDGQG